MNKEEVLGSKPFVTGWKNPYLGFGMMRLPVENGGLDMDKAGAMVQEYMKGSGLKYFDTHPSYMQGKSQSVIRELVVEQYPRDSYLLANKMPYYGLTEKRDYENIFVEELRCCGVSYFDYYMLHALTEETYEMHERLGGFLFLEEKKKEGTVKHIGFSFHDKPELLEKILERHPEVEFVQLQINYLDWDSPVICSRKCYEIVRNYKKQIMVMEPVKGGSLANPVKIDGRVWDRKELAAYALSFVAKLPGIFVILSGMTEVDHIIQNQNTIATADGKMAAYDDKVYEQLCASIKKYHRVPCTSCQYCVRECPRKIAIPEILSLVNACSNTGADDHTFLGRYKIFYKGYVYRKGKAGDCIGCGRCESKCPQKLPIRKLLNQAAGMFEREEKSMYYYTTERNTQILIYLLKAHGIKKVIASPGTTNINLVYSLQQDSFFELYSVVDERSAAYMACGMAAESGEPVVLSCTGATASRNYIPALTEAFYRKLPVLAVTSTHFTGNIGHNMPQIIDRSTGQRDIVKLSVEIPAVQNLEEAWCCETRINQALLELKHHGGGPVHINLTTSCSGDFSAKKLPVARIIDRIMSHDTFPQLQKGRIGIFVGAHKKWEDDLTKAVDCFCRLYHAVVLCDHTSNYKGKYGVQANLVMNQGKSTAGLNNFDVLIHIGDVSGSYMKPLTGEVWRVSSDGAIVDTFHKLRYVFEMEEIDFFKRYSVSQEEDIDENIFWKEWDNEYHRLLKSMPELPFSNAWIAQVTSKRIPDDTVLHLGILNSLRCWNLFRIPETVSVYCNTGGFGIDGCLSSLLGASLICPDKLFLGVIGDLSFFYDMNALGNRHLGSNIRLMVINNGGGAEFKKYNHLAARFGDDADDYIAAKGHFGNQSADLIKDYAKNLGFGYMCASNKEEYMSVLPEFLNPQIVEKPMLLEVFTDSRDESEALRLINAIDSNPELSKEKAIKQFETYRRPQQISESIQTRKIVLWGTGKCFTQNYLKVEERCEIAYICDNEESKWNKEILPGIRCISPEELSRMKDVFVVIMIENVKAAFQVASQLRDMGIRDFDHIYNWLNDAR